MTDSAPIAAIATANGRGGIGVVRISGAALADFAHALLGKPLRPRHAHYLPFHDAQGGLIDSGLALYFPAPHSYTGEDVIELHGHGGPAVLRRLLARCVEVGVPWRLRLAEAGEFTRRAFLNDRLDLAQAEAVADLIDASSEAAARSAAASLAGEFSRQVRALAERLLRLRMLVEATLDFPEEDIDFLEQHQARATLAAVSQALSAVLAQARQGAILRDGVHVVLAGEPNVGKSSLLNALAGEDIAIVTPVAGTTRDKVVSQIEIDGVPVHIVDTAGLRDSDDAIERIGIARAWQEIERADAIIHLYDITRPAGEGVSATELTGQRGAPISAQITARAPARVPVLQVANKIDLLPAAPSVAQTHEAPAVPAGTLAISARTGAGLPALRLAILQAAGWLPGEQSPWLARQRHVLALQEAAQHLEQARRHAAQHHQALDLFAEELRLAHTALGRITGQVSSDDLLGEIFAGFCIGK